MYDKKTSYLDTTSTGAVPDKPWWVVISESTKEERKKQALLSDKCAISQAISDRCGVLKDNRDKMGVSDDIRTNTLYYDLKSIEDIWNPYMKKQSNYNVIRSNVNTARSQNDKNRPKIAVVSQDGNASLNLQCRYADQFVATMFDLSKIYAQTSMMQFYGNLKKVGVIKSYFDTMKEEFMVKACDPEKIWVYVRESDMSSDTREVMEMKHICPYELCEKFPHAKDKIKEMERNDDGEVDCYTIYYFGKYKVTFAGGMALEIEEIGFESPFDFWRWTDSALGSFYGSCLADELFPSQTAINKILLQIAKSGDLVAIPRMLVHKANQITSAALTSEIGDVLKFAGEFVPQVLTPPMMSPQYFDLLDKFVHNSSAITSGISMMNIGGEVPGSASRSAKAMRTLNEIGSNRFHTSYTSFEDVHKSLARRLLIQAHNHYKKKGDKSKYSFVRKMDWESIDLEKRPFVIQTPAANLLSDDPARFYEDVEAIGQTGVIEPDIITDAMDKFPDMKRNIRRATAPRRYAAMVVDDIISGKEEYPEVATHVPVEILLREAQKGWSWAALERVDKKILKKIEDYILKIKEAMMPSTVPPQGATDAAQGVTPQENPEIPASTENSLGLLQGTPIG